jgi:hypothetical protein
MPSDPHIHSRFRTSALADLGKGHPAVVLLVRWSGCSGRVLMEAAQAAAEAGLLCPMTTPHRRPSERKRSGHRPPTMPVAGSPEFKQVFSGGEGVIFPSAREGTAP